jgi:C_GCAxxG_C_C family probable redox protein
VLLAVAEHMDIHSELIPRITTGFCGGIAHTGGYCGAVSAGIMAINLALGRSLPTDDREACYQGVRSFLERFSAKFGSLDCARLIGLDLSKPEYRELYWQKSLHEQCTDYVVEAARLAVDIVERKED